VLPDIGSQAHASTVPSIPTLKELIAEKRGLRGFSYGQLEARAGHAISRQRWQQLATESRVKEFSEPATIKAMATALDADESLVVLAMAKSIGLNVDGGGAQSELAQMLPAAARTLTADQRQAILELVRVIGQQQQSLDDLQNRATLDGLESHVDEMNIEDGDNRTQEGR